MRSWQSAFVEGFFLVELEPVPPEMLMLVMLCPGVVVSTEGVTLRCLEGNLSEHFLHGFEPRSVVVARIDVTWFIVEDMLRGGGQGHEVYQLTLFCVASAVTVLDHNVSSKLEALLDLLRGAGVEVVIVSVVNEGYFHVTLSSI